MLERGTGILKLEVCDDGRGVVEALKRDGVGERGHSKLCAWNKKVKGNEPNNESYQCVSVVIDLRLTQSGSGREELLFHAVVGASSFTVCTWPSCSVRV